MKYKHFLYPIYYYATHDLLSWSKFDDFFKEVCYSLAELYVISVYMNLFGWRERKVHETFVGGGQSVKFWESLPYAYFSLLCRDI
jgi:hypothetical protein